MPMCPMCQRQFGTASIDIHVKQCYQKRLQQWEAQHPSERGPRPVMPVKRGAQQERQQHLQDGMPAFLIGDEEPQHRMTQQQMAGSHWKQQDSPFAGLGAHFDRNYDGFRKFGNGIGTAAPNPEQSSIPRNRNGVAPSKIPKKSTASFEFGGYELPEGAPSFNAGCRFCGRNFATDRLPKHESVCQERPDKKKKKVFNAKKQVLGDLAREAMQAKQNNRYASNHGPSRKADWRQQHEEFQAAMRAARGAGGGGHGGGWSQHPQRQQQLRSTKNSVPQKKNMPNMNFYDDTYDDDESGFSYGHGAGFGQPSSMKKKPIMKSNPGAFRECVVPGMGGMGGGMGGMGGMSRGGGRGGISARDARVSQSTRPVMKSNPSAFRECMVPGSTGGGFGGGGGGDVVVAPPRRAGGGRGGMVGGGGGGGGGGRIGNSNECSADNPMMFGRGQRFGF